MAKQKLSGMLEKECFALVEFCDSMIQGERVQGQMSICIINAQSDCFLGKTVEVELKFGLVWFFF